MIYGEENIKTESKHTNEELYYRQVEMLKLFLERSAISREQYDKSLHDLTEKMSINKPEKRID